MAAILTGYLISIKNNRFSFSYVFSNWCCGVTLLLAFHPWGTRADTAWARDPRIIRSRDPGLVKDFQIFIRPVSS